MDSSQLRQKFLDFFKKKRAPAFAKATAWRDVVINFLT